MTHTCHAHGCTKAVPPKMFMCRTHWFSLSKPLQRAIWREYRPGQEVDKKPTARYLAVQQRAVAEVAFKPRSEEAAAVAAEYLLKSEQWRKLAIAQGEGDPLEGFSNDTTAGRL